MPLNFISISKSHDSEGHQPHRQLNSETTVTRIFLTLASLSTLLLLTVFVIGLSIDDPKLIESMNLKRWHLGLAIGGLIAATLVHALVLTYFMGTGRWMEDVSKAYQLEDRWRRESQSLKYRVLPAMSGCFVLLLVTVGFGAAADPGSGMKFGGLGGLSAGTCHLLIAFITVCCNFFANVLELQAIERNSQLVNEVVAKVREIRIARGLPV